MHRRRDLQFTDMIPRFRTSFANSDLWGKEGTQAVAATRDQAMDLGLLAFDSSSSNSQFDQRILLLGRGGCGGSQVYGGARLALAGDEGGSKRRAFFASPDELLEEDYYCDEQLQEKKRRLTPEQVHLLERSFEEENKLEPERKSELAQKLGLQPRQVAVWFQNRRARWKTKQLEQDFDCLRSSYNNLLSDHDSLLHENDQLRLQVVSLTEKLHSKTATTAAAAEIARIKVDDQAASVAHLMPPNVQMKVEDRLSTGSGGSAVLDRGDGANHLADSEESVPEGYDCVNPIDGRIPSEEADNVSDEGCNYYSDGIFAAEHHHREEEGAQMGWWVWN